MGLISRVSSRTYRFALISALLKMANSELCCTYAALILHDSDVEINADNLNKVIKAAGVSVEPFWPGLFASALSGIDVNKLITNISSGVGASTPTGGAAAGGASADAAPAEEAKKEESEESDSDSDMGFGGLF